MAQETRWPESKANKLAYRWLTNSEAFRAASINAVEVEALRQGVGLLSREQFREGLINEEFFILMLPHNCAALCSFGECEQGKVCNVLTTTGNKDYATDCLLALEAAAIKRGANIIMSVGHLGWTKFLISHGYSVKKVMLMRKDLNHARTLS